MDDKFKNKYKISSIRLKNYDYSQNGFYYITICTKNKVFYFGKIINNKMVLNKYGQIVKKCWLEIPNHFPFIKLDQFIIMSNHLHGILIIKKQATKTKKFTPLQFGPQSQNLPSVIRGFKAGASKMKKLKLKTERVMGIEPTSSPWKGDILPVYYTRFIKE